MLGAQSAMFAPIDLTVPLAKRMRARQQRRPVRRVVVAAQVSRKVEPFDRFGDIQLTKAQERRHDVGDVDAGVDLAAFNALQGRVAQ